MKSKIFILSIFTSLILASCAENTQTATTASTPPNYFDAVRESFTGDVAYETTAFVEKYWRIAGNTGYNETIYRIAQKLEEAGYVLESEATPEDVLTYRIEKREMKNKTWEPVDASLSVAGSDQMLLEYATNRNMIFLNSVSTPEEGLTTEVVHIKRKEDLAITDMKGKIVFAEMSPYALYKNAIVEGGAVGLVTYNNPSYLQPEKNTTSIQFRSLPYSEDVQVWGIALSYDAKEKLKAALQNGSTQLKVNIKTKVYASEELTVVANVKGSELPKESFVFSAHIQEPGANDNASGVGAQLEMAMVTAQLLTTEKIEAKRTLTFLWGDEIISTRRYIAEKDKRSAEINWGVSLDMVGENTALTGGSFLIEKMPDPSAIWTRGNDKHSEWGGQVLALEDMKPHYLNDLMIDIFKQQGAFANWEVNTNPFEGGSDHTPFLRADIPGLLLWHFTDQFYHTDNDRIDKVSKETLKNVSVGALVSAYTLINADYSTAQQVIETISKAAETRLNAEFELSKKAIEDGNSLEDETNILSTWSTWYLEALSTTEDLVAKPNENLKTDIAEAKKVLEETTNTLLQNLSK